MLNFKPNTIGIFIISSLAIGSASAVEIRDNKFCLKNATFKKFTPQQSPYNSQSYSITQGQPWESVLIDKDDGCLHVKAGRHANKSNVDWVKNTITAKETVWSKSNMAADARTDNDIPPDLNFAIFGTITIMITNPPTNTAYICSDVSIGQGSHGIFSTIEDWWLFANNNYAEENKLDKGVYLHCMSEGDQNLANLELKMMSGGPGFFVTLLNGNY